MISFSTNWFAVSKGSSKFGLKIAVNMLHKRILLRNRGKNKNDYVKKVSLNTYIRIPPKRSQRPNMKKWLNPKPISLLFFRVGILNISFKNDKIFT